MNNNDINLEEMRVEAEKMLPGLGEFIQEGETDNWIRITPSETLDLFGARSVEEIDRILDSENLYLRALIDKPRVDFPFRRYRSTLRCFFPVSDGYLEEAQKIIEEIRRGYEEEEKHPMSLSIFLSRESGESYLDQVIQEIKRKNTHFLEPPMNPWIPLDAPSRVSGGAMDIPVSDYGKEKFISTSSEDNSIGVAMMIEKPEEPKEIIDGETTGKEIEKTRNRILRGLDGTDRRLLTACDMELEAGNNPTTLNRLFHNMGNTGNINEKIEDDLMNRLDKLDSYRVRLDNKSEEISGWDYKRYPVRSALVPNMIIEDPERISTFNGQPARAQVFFLVDHFPFREFSRTRGQGNTIPKELYQTGNRKTPEYCLMEDYLIERIIWRDDRLKRVIYKTDPETGERTPVSIEMHVAWSKLYSVSKITEAGRQKLYRFRKAVIRALEKWKKLGFILDFEADSTKKSISIYLPPDPELVKAIENRLKKEISEAKKKNK